MKCVFTSVICLMTFLSANTQCDSIQIEMDLLEEKYNLLADFSEKLEFLKESIAHFTNSNCFEEAIDWYGTVIYITKNEKDINEHFIAIQSIDHLLIKYDDKISEEFKINMNLRKSYFWFEFYLIGGYESKALQYASNIETLVSNTMDVLPKSTKLFLVNIYRLIWNHFYKKNEFQTSLVYLNRAIEIAEKIEDPESRLVAESLLLGSYSLVYFKVKENQKAKVACFQHLEKAKDLIQYNKRYKGHLYTANGRLARWYMENNSLDSALYYGREYSRLVKNYNSSPYLSDILRANIFVHKADYDIAKSILRNLIEYEGGIGEMIENRSLRNCFEVVDLLIQSEDFENAIALQDSINLYLKEEIKSNQDLKVPINTSNEKHLLDLMLSKLNLPKEYLDHNSKLQAIEEANSLINIGLSNISNKQDKLFFSKNSAILSALTLESLNIDKNEVHELAFSAIERSKAATLINSWKQKQLISFSNKEDVFSREKNLENALELLSIKILEESDSSSIVMLRNKVLSKNYALDSIKTVLKNSHLSYFKMKYDWQNPTIQEIQSKLTTDEVYIDYFEGENTLYAMLISNEESKVIKIPDLEGIKVLIDLYSKLIFTIYDDSAQREINALSYKLYQHLLKPFEDLLKENIIVSPSGVLNQLPFSTFRINNSLDLDGLLIMDHSISYTPSASMFFQSRSNPSKQVVRNSLFVAPKFQKNKKTQELIAMRSSLGELRFNVEEVESISSSMNSHTIVNENASKSEFLRNIFDADLLHFATHAKSDEDAPDRSFIAFYSKNAEESDSNLLYLDELSKLNLPAKMIVLSACETGLGKIYKGEGAMSLANACFYAGSESVVATLWSVQDQTTSEIMKSFYTHLDQGQNKDKAMQLAQIDYINNHSQEFQHPYFWAGFSVFGNTSDLQFNKGNSLRNSVLGIISILLLLIAVFHVRRTRQIS